MAIKDTNGLEGMPLKLVIIAAMIALSVPPVYGSLSNFQDAASTNMMRNTVEEIAGVVQRLVSMGPGNQRTLSISIPTDGSFLIIGGATRSEMMSIGYGSKGEEPTRYYLTDPNVIFSTPCPNGMVIEGPACEICFRCIDGPSGRLIEVMV